VGVGERSFARLCEFLVAYAPGREKPPRRSRRLRRTPARVGRGVRTAPTPQIEPRVFAQTGRWDLVRTVAQYDGELDRRADERLRRRRRES
jgi:hypothetical protein